MKKISTLTSISCILMGGSIISGFWRAHGYLIRLGESISGILNIISSQTVDVNVLKQVGDLLAGISELLQKSNLF